MVGAVTCSARASRPSVFGPPEDEHGQRREPRRGQPALLVDPAHSAPFDDEPHLIARMPDHELWMTFFRDPDRNVHGLMAEVS
jgi:hypothetical protein